MNKDLIINIILSILLGLGCTLAEALIFKVFGFIFPLIVYPILITFQSLLFYKLVSSININKRNALIISGILLSSGLGLIPTSDTGAKYPSYGFDDSSYGTFAWVTPQYITSSDSKYATSKIGDGFTHYLKATGFDFSSIPDSATIDGIQVDIQRYKSGNGGDIKDAVVQLLKSNSTTGSNKADTINSWPTTDTWKTYGGSSDLWSTTWSPSDIKNSNFGIVLSAKAGNSEYLDESCTSGTSTAQIYSTRYCGQDFNVDCDILTKVDLYVEKDGSPPSDLYLRVRRDSMTGSVLASTSVPASNIDALPSWVTFDFSDVDVSSLTKVYIEVYMSGGDASNCYKWYFSTSNPYSGGIFHFSTNGGSSWLDYTNYDAQFKSYGYDASIANVNAMRITVYYTDTSGNNPPSISNPYPANASTGVSLQPTCHIDVSDSDGDTMNISWYENSTGSWVLRQTNSSVTNGTYYWQYTQASSYSTTYYWKVIVDDGTDNTSAIYHFTTKSNTPPSQSNPSPSNNSETVLPTISQLSIDISESDGDTVNWYIETSPNIGSSSGTGTGTKTCSVSGVQAGNRYTWFVNVTDGTDWTNRTYYFITIPQKPQSFITVTYNYTVINLSWSKGIGEDYTYIRYSTSSYPTSRTEGAFLCNTTGTSYSATGLQQGTKYYFTAWSYNTTYSSYSYYTSTNSNSTGSTSLTLVDSYDSGYITENAPAIYDFNNDGIMEIVTCEKTRVAVYNLISGSITLKASYSIDVYTKYGSPVIADVDGDGIKEIIAPGSSLYIFNYTGSSLTLEYSYTPGDDIYSTPSVNNIDGTGNPEIFFTSNDGYLYVVHVSSGSLSLVDKYSIFTATTLVSPSSVMIKDLNKDGTIDFTVCSRNGYLRVFKLVGSLITLEASINTNFDGEWSTPACADLDGDGNIEFVFPSNSHYVYVYRFSGSSITTVDSYDTGSGLEEHPAIADIDGDGQLEFIIGGNKLYVFNLSSNTIHLEASHQETGTNWGFFSSPAISDVDGDSRQEIIIGNDNYNMTIFSWDSTTFDREANYTTTDQIDSCSPVVGDIDNDGNLEIVSFNSDGILYIWRYGSQSTSEGWLQFGYDLNLTGYKNITYPQFNVLVSNPYPQNSSSNVNLKPVLSVTLNSTMLSSIGHSNWHTYGYNFSHWAIAEYNEFSPINNTLLWTANVTGTNDEYCGPVVHDGIVYISSKSVQHNKTYAIYLNNGTIKWETITGKVDDTPTYYKGYLFVSSAPSASSFATYTYRLYCLYANNGTVKWEVNFTTDTHKGGGSPVIDDVNNLVIWLADGALRAYFIDTGLPKWIYEFEDDCRTESTPAYYDGKVFVSLYFSSTSTNHFVDFCINSTNGQLIWKLQEPGTYSGTHNIGAWDAAPVVVPEKNAVYFPDYGDFDTIEIKCRNITNGNLYWTYNGVYQACFGLTYHNNRLYGGFKSSTVLCLNATTSDIGDTAREIWSYSTGIFSDVYSIPAYSNGYVYFGSLNDKIQCLYANNGTLKWNYTVGADIHSQPAIADGILLIGSDNWNLYALGDLSQYNKTVDSDKTLTIYWKYNNSGTWTTIGTTSEVKSNGTYYMEFSQASSYSTTYQWGVFITDGLGNWSNSTYSFTTKSNTNPLVSNVYPLNNSNNIELQPICKFNLNDADGDTMNIFWYENTTDSWVLRQIDSRPFSNKYYFSSITGNTNSFEEDIAILNSTHFVVAYKDPSNSYGKVKIGVINDQSISYGSEYTFNSAVTGYIDVDNIGESKFIIVYRDNGNSGYGTAIIGTVSGTSISFGSEYVYNSATSNFNSVSTLDSAHCVIAYSDAGDNEYGKSVIATITDTSISFGSTYTFNSDDTDNFGGVDTLDSTHFVVAYRDYTNHQGEAIVGSVSGTTITFGTLSVFNSDDHDYCSLSVLDSSHFVIAFDDNGQSSYGKCIVGSVSGTTISFGTESIFESFDSSNIFVESLSASKCVLSYSSNDYSYIKVCNISSLSISGYYLKYKLSDNICYDIKIDNFSNENYVVIFKDNSNNLYGSSVLGTINMTVSWQYTQATSENTKYYWKVVISDSVNSVSNIYNFITIKYYRYTIRNDGIDYFIWLGGTTTASVVDDIITGFDEASEYIAVWKGTTWSSDGIWLKYYGDGSGTNFNVEPYDVIKIYLTDTGTQIISMTASSTFDYTASRTVKLINSTNKGANYTGYTGSQTSLSSLASTIGLANGEVISLWDNSSFTWKIYIIGFWEPSVTVPKNSVIYTKVGTTRSWTIPGEDT